MPQCRTVELDLIFVHETEHAVLLKDDESSHAEWFSKSHVDYDDEHILPNMVGTFSIDEASAIEAGFV